MANIRCNTCPELRTKKRRIKEYEQRIRNIWTFTCGRLIIGTFDIRNQDLKDFELPEIKPPFVCRLRQEARKKGIESYFELQIS